MFVFEFGILVWWHMLICFLVVFSLHFHFNRVFHCNFIEYFTIFYVSIYTLCIIYYCRLFRARIISTWCSQITKTLFYNERMAFRYFISFTNRFCIFLVGTKKMSNSSTMPSYCAFESSISLTTNARMVWTHRNCNWLSECISYL